MAQMLLVNPRRRKRRRKASSRKASAPRRRRRSRRRASTRTVRARRRNPIRYVRRSRRRSRRRSNPINLNLRSVQGQVMDAATGAAGAVALSVALGYLPIPENFKTGALAPVTKGVVAIGLGMLLANVVKGSTAARMTQGALTVILADVGRGLMTQFAPSVRLAGDGDLGYYGSGWNPNAPATMMGDYLPDISAANSFDTSMGMYADGTGY